MGIELGSSALHTSVKSITLNILNQDINQLPVSKSEFLNRSVATGSSVCCGKLVCHSCVTKKWCVAIRKRRKTQCQDKYQCMMCPNLSLANKQWCQISLIVIY